MLNYVYKTNEYFLQIMDSEEGAVVVYSEVLPFRFLEGDDLKYDSASITMYTQVTLLDLLAL